MKTFKTTLLKTFILCIGFLISCLQAYAQPANALCANATLLNCGGSLSGTTVGTTASNPTDPSNCASRYGVWYRFVGDGQTTTVSMTSPGWDAEMVVFSGACGSLTNLVCKDEGLSGGTETYSWVATSGVTYYIYVAHYNTSYTTTGTFTITRTCLAAPAAPAQCSTAPTLNCGATISGTTVGAPASTGHGSCAGNYGAWYTFVGNGQSTTITVAATSSWDHEVVILSGTCTSLANVSCTDGTGSGGTETVTFTPANGTTYFVYIAHYSTTSTSTGTFTITRTCTEPPAAPALCASAPTLNCGATLSGTTVGAASSTGHGSCAGNYGAWYTFVGNGQSTTITVAATSSWDHEVVILSGTCTSLTNVSCTDGSGTSGTETVTFTAVNGTTYFVYIAHYSTSSTSTGTFTISRTCEAPPAPPVLCTTAPTLNCGATLSGTTVGVASSTGHGSCAGNYGAWYTFVGNGQLNTITVTATTSWDQEIVILSGTCAALTSISCTDNSASGGTESISFTAINGTTYFVYIAHFSTSGTSTGTFTISRTCTTAPDLAVPGGSTCSSSAAFCTNNSIIFPNTTGGSTAQTGPNYGCTTMQPNPVWYYMQIETGGPLQLTITQLSSSNSSIDVDFTMWGPFSNPTSACTSIQSGIAPIQAGYSIANVETVGLGMQGGSYLSNTGCIGVTTPPNAVAGQTYVVMITNYSGTEGTISFAQTGGTASTNCAIVTLGSLLELSAYHRNNKNVIQWTVEHEMNTSYYKLVSSTDGKNWREVGMILSKGVFDSDLHYEMVDENYHYNNNLYKLVTVDVNGDEHESKIINIDNSLNGNPKEIIKIINTLGQEVDQSYEGLKIFIFSDGTSVKQI